MGEILGLGCTHYPGLLGPDDKLPGLFHHLLTAPNVGHGVSQLGCAARLLRSFLDRPQDKLDGACLKEIPAPTFQLGSAGPQP